MKAIKIIRADLSHAEEILVLQKEAYLSEAEIYQDFQIPPLQQTVEEIRQEIQSQTILAAIINEQIVGSVRAYLQEDTCYIGKLIVNPDYQNHGLGKQLLGAIEAEFTHCKRYELFTGHLSLKNLYLYQKTGYRIIRQDPVNQSLTMIFLEKINPSFISR